MEVRVMEAKILGDYTIIKQIGQGSFGAVYLAEHRYMKKQYVLKVLPEELATDRSFIQRFEEDVSLLASLDHPNIVKMYNISFSQGQYFLVTDCIVDDLSETTNLAQYIAGGQKNLSEEVIYNILAQVASALDYAHNKKTSQLKIIHYCLKLNNILIGKTKNGRLEVFLSDFGLSRIIGPAAMLTRSYKNVAESLGILSALGSAKNLAEKYPNPALESQKYLPLHISFLQNFAFLAPEQKRVDSTKSVDKKADVYAFGVLAYLLLMQEFPEGYFEMPSKVYPDYQKGWDLLIRECLQTDPNNRPDLILPALEKVMTPLKLVENVGEQKPLENFIFEEKLQQIYPPFQEMGFKDVVLNSFPSEPTHKTVSTGLTNAPQRLRPVIHVAELQRPETDPDPGAIFNIDTTVKQYTPELKEIRNIQPMRTEMIVIPGGNFLRGSNDGNRDEHPRHQVHISSFAIDVHPVINEQFVRFLEVLGGEKDNNHQDVIRLRDSRIKRSGGKLSIESGYAKHPVVGVTWYGAMAYAKWVGMRLPTEAEWEIASYAGLEGVLYPTGEDIEKTQANFFSSDTTAVMSYPPNDYGLYDMSGNVYEWCYDWYGYNYYEVSIQEPENPMGPLQGVYRVLRGGCWKSLKEDLRSSRRHRNNPGTVNGTYGFRCVTDVQ
jgi:formylglycine-generating enzyme required for sulfatase activity